MDPLPVRYRLPSGSPVISVTQTLQVEQRIDTTWFSAAARWRGQEVHRLTEVFDRGGALHIPEGLHGYLDAYASFVATVRPTYAASELKVVKAAMRLGGRIDRVCADLWGTPAILDFKTGDPYPWHGRQLAAYNLLRPTGARWGCYLRADGTYRLTLYDDPADHRRFVFDLKRATSRIVCVGEYWIEAAP